MRSKGLIHKRVHRRDLLSITSIFIALGVYVYTSIVMYVFVATSAAETNLYAVFQAIGVVVLGYISDKYCRRKMALLSQIAGLICIVFLLLFTRNLWWIMLAGLFYNPLSVLISALIDNLPDYSKVKLIGLAFVAQTIPWCFYNRLIQKSDHYLLIGALILISVSLFLTFLFFHDRRDLASHGSTYFNVHNLIHPSAKKRFGYTFVAFFPPQLVFFYLDNLLESYNTNPEFYSIMSVACVIGALFAIVYKKTPHVSVLTIIYGISVLIASIPIICLYLFNFRDIGMPSNFIIFSCLSVFSLPFVYDVILNSVNANHRGLTCGILEAVDSVGSIVNVAMFNLFEMSMLVTLLSVVILFLISTFLQKQAE